MPGLMDYKNNAKLTILISRAHRFEGKRPEKKYEEQNLYRNRFEVLLCFGLVYRAGA